MEMIYYPHNSFRRNTMAEDLQSLLEKINRDGVEKAQAQADGILADAKAKAAAIVKEAEDTAAKAKAASEKAAADYAERAKETIRQAARDTVLAVEAAVTKTLENLLAKDVKAALSDSSAAARLAMKAIEGLAGAAEVAAANKELASALKAQLAAKGDIKVVLDETLDSGFTVRTDGGRVEHSFTGATVAEELAKALRSDLAALMK